MPFLESKDIGKRNLEVKAQSSGVWKEKITCISYEMFTPSNFLNRLLTFDMESASTQAAVLLCMPGHVSVFSTILESCQNSRLFWRKPVWLCCCRVTSLILDSQIDFQRESAREIRSRLSCTPKQLVFVVKITEFNPCEPLANTYLLDCEMSYLG